MEEKQLILEAWKQTIETQMRFNEISMKVRAFSLTLLAAMLTAETLYGQHSNTLLLSILIVWAAFYLVDRWWYHYLLLGAVLHGSDIEKKAADLGLTFTINGETKSILGLTQRISKLNQEGVPWKAKYKLDLYYALVAIALLILFLGK